MKVFTESPASGPLYSVNSQIAARTATTDPLDPGIFNIVDLTSSSRAAFPTRVPELIQSSNPRSGVPDTEIADLFSLYDDESTIQELQNILNLGEQPVNLSPFPGGCEVQAPAQFNNFLTDSFTDIDYFLRDSASAEVAAVPSRSASPSSWSVETEGLSPTSVAPQPPTSTTPVSTVSASTVETPRAIRPAGCPPILPSPVAKPVALVSPKQEKLPGKKHGHTLLAGGGGDDKPKRDSHSAVERKRRDLMNERIGQLKNLIPLLLLDSPTPNKATVLGKAVEYMCSLQGENEKLRSERVFLETEIHKLQRLLTDPKARLDPDADADPDADQSAFASGSGSGSGSASESPSLVDDESWSDDATSRGHGHGVVPPSLWHTWRSAGRVAVVGVSARAVAVSLPRITIKQFIATALKLTMENIVVTDPALPDHPIMFASPGFCKTTGYGAEEVLGRNARFLQGPGTDPNTVRQMAAAVRDGREFMAELLNYKKDGSAFWNLMYIMPITTPAGPVGNFLGVVFDITRYSPSGSRDKRPRSQSRLGSGPGEDTTAMSDGDADGDGEGDDETASPRGGAEGRGAADGEGPAKRARMNVTERPAVANTGLKQLVAAMVHTCMQNVVVADVKPATDAAGDPCGGVVADKVVYTSRGMQRLTGFSRDELLGKPVRALADPDALDAATVRAMDLCMVERKPCVAEMVYRTKDGTRITNLVFVAPIVDPSGTPLRFIFLHFDVSGH